MEIKILLAEDDMNLGFVVTDHLKSEGIESSGVFAIFSFGDD